VLDWLALRTGTRMPFDAESLELMVQNSEHPNVTFDQSPTNVDFGLPRTPLEETLRDTLRWLYEAGHISRRQAGSLALRATAGDVSGA
jgi:hypothetical protein